VGHARCDHLEAGRFESGIDLADHVLGDCVWLDDGEGAFDCHGIFLSWSLLEFLRIFAD
jgi:hypothetical protein